MGAQHTPGPWRVEGAYVVGDAGVIARQAAPYSDASDDLRLIAAAPMLLEALEQIGHSIKQARIVGNDWKRELALIENTVDAALAAATLNPEPTP